MECPPMTGQGGWEGEGLALVAMSGCKDDKVADQAPVCFEIPGSHKLIAQ
jgi:hypothetical protein